MVSACVFATLLEHPASQVHRAMEDPFARRALMGLAMGLTAIAIICSPFGRRSGAHMNPSVTLTFLSLGKLARIDGLFYIASQFAGGAIGVYLAWLMIGPALEDTGVHYVVTEPGSAGIAVAFAAEFAISLVLMLAVLIVSNTASLARATPFVAGLLVALYITFEAPLSGMSMNPARTFGSALVARDWTALWIYFTAPPAGMLLAGQLYRLRWGVHRVFCAKLHHHNSERCIFRCNYAAMQAESTQAGALHDSH